MVVINGYSIEQYPNRNCISIGLPQTAETATNTTLPVVKRKTTLENKELMAILMAVITFYNQPE